MSNLNWGMDILIIKRGNLIIYTILTSNNHINVIKVLLIGLTLKLKINKLKAFKWIKNKPELQSC